MIVVIDTNVMLPLFGKNAPYAAIVRALVAGRIRLATSQSILLEYEEILYARLGAAGWLRIVAFLDLLVRTGRLIRVDPGFRFRVIADESR